MGSGSCGQGPKCHASSERRTSTCGEIEGLLTIAEAFAEYTPRDRGDEQSYHADRDGSPVCPAARTRVCKRTHSHRGA